MNTLKRTIFLSNIKSQVFNKFNDITNFEPEELVSYCSGDDVSIFWNIDCKAYLEKLDEDC
jgi:hypothetical protein